MTPTNLAEVHERLNDLDQARHRDLQGANDRFERVEERVDDLELRAKAKSEKLNSTVLKFTETVGAMKTTLATLSAQVKVIMWVLATVGIVVIGNVVRSWF